VEHGGDGGDKDLGGLSGIEDQGENSRKELVAVNCGDGLQRENDVGADGVRNGSDVWNYLRPGSFDFVDSSE
jgi:hypothetical protein